MASQALALAPPVPMSIDLKKFLTLTTLLALPMGGCDSSDEETTGTSDDPTAATAPTTGQTTSASEGEAEAEAESDPTDADSTGATTEGGGSGSTGATTEGGGSTGATTEGGSTGFEATGGSTGLGSTGGSTTTG